MAFQLLLAANWLEGLVPLLLVIFWIVRAFLEAKGEQRAAPKGDVIDIHPDDLQLDDGGPAAEALVVDERGNRGGDDVEDFFRRYSEEPHREERTGAETVRGERPRQEKPRPPRRRPQRRKLKPAVAESEPAALDVDRGVERRVGHLQESQLAERASHLGETVAHSDDRMAARLHQKFDHRLGKLGSTTETPDAEPATPEQPATADAIAAMLANPEGVRNAVILNEILRPPTERW